MESEDSRDAGGDASSSSSSDSTGPRRPSRSSSSERSTASRPLPAASRSPSSPRSPSPRRAPRSPPGTASDGRSDINSPENSPPASPHSQSRGASSPAPPKSPDADEDSSSAPIHHGGPRSPPLSPPKGPKTPQSPMSPMLSTPASPEAVSGPASPEAGSGPASPDAGSGHASSEARSGPASPEAGSGPASPDSLSGPTSPQSPRARMRTASSDPGSPATGPASPTAASPGNIPPTRSLKSPRSPQSRTARDWSPKVEWSRRKLDRHSRSGSESSRSSRDSSYNKRATVKDPATEEISDGEMESDQDSKSRGKSRSPEPPPAKPLAESHLNISHEDLSDVSDLDSMGADDDIDKNKKPKSPTPSKHSTDSKLNGNQSKSSILENGTTNSEIHKLEKTVEDKTSKPEDGEELDFEAEEGECVEAPPAPTPNHDQPPNSHPLKEDDAKSIGEASNASSLEEGEVSDEGERRPEESEPRPVCRFYSRGQCTWGISCRFLHPGVTDKGNYSMFEVVRGVPTHAPPVPFAPRVEPPPPESAWERGLRTAKEMLRQANKRKEQDIDFEEKKLHLSVGGTVHDPDAELAYAAAAVGASPPRSHDYPEMTHPHLVHHPHRQLPPHLFPRGGFGPPHRRAFNPGRPEERDPFERLAYDRPTYERPTYERPHERPHERRAHYEDPALRYEDRKPTFEERTVPVEDEVHHKRRVRSSREVIVQRAPGAREAAVATATARPTAGDDWADPWMRESAAARRRRPPSSHSSYSTSSSSHSSSRSSRSPGSRRGKRRASPNKQRLSPSVIVRERRQATARATAMNPPAPRRRAPSPAAARQHAANPPAPTQPLRKATSHAARDGVDAFGRNKPPNRSGRKRYTSSSGSESSSSSSGSESESHSSSSSGSSSDARRARTVRALNAANRPRLTSKPAGLGPGTIAAAANKKDTLVDQKENTGSKKRSATSPAPDPTPAKKSVSRREELLKQLKAVEDAIARKRSKI